MSAWKKNISQRLHLLPPLSHGPWPLMAAGLTQWLSRHWCGSAAALHPQSHMTPWGQASHPPQKAESKLSHHQEGWCLRLKKITKGSFTAGEATSLVHTCRSLGSWARMRSQGSTCVTEWARGFSSIPVAQGFQQLLALLREEFYS